jgi:hypothetical protein
MPLQLARDRRHQAGVTLEEQVARWIQLTQNLKAILGQPEETQKEAGV